MIEAFLVTLTPYVGHFDRRLVWECGNIIPPILSLQVLTPLGSPALKSRARAASKEDTMGRSYFANRQPETVLSQSSWIMTLSGANITSDTLEQLIPHASVPMLERIGENPATPLEILEKLAIWDDAQVRAAVAENPCCPLPLMRTLIEDESPDVRFRLAECPHVPIDLLEELAHDDNCYVAHRARRTIDRARRTFQRLPVSNLETAPESKKTRVS
jgi:hypothetical protein